MPSFRFISSPPISSRATASCCRRARPPQAIVASTAIPGAFAPIRYKDFYLADGAISSNTPIRVAVAKGARRLIILPTGYACATQHAAGRRGRQCAACADAADRAAIGQRAGRPRPRHRILRGAAAMSAGGIALRFLANRRIISSARSRAPMPGWRKAAWSKAAFPTRCARTAIEPICEAPASYVALQKAVMRDIDGSPGRIDSPPADSVASRAARCHIRDLSRRISCTALFR